MSDVDTSPPDGFRVIPGYPRYAINESGVVLSVCVKGRGPARNKPWSKATRLSFSTNREGYQKVQLTHEGRPRCMSVHCLVLLAFVGPCPEGLQCRHLDGNPANNHLSNLAWGTRSENAQDAIAHGTAICGERSCNAKLTEADVIEIRSRRARGYSLDEIAFDFEVSIITISTIVQRRAWKHVK